MEDPGYERTAIDHARLARQAAEDRQADSTLVLAGVIARSATAIVHAILSLKEK